MPGLRDPRLFLTLYAALCACPPDADTTGTTDSSTGTTTTGTTTTGEPTTGDAASTGLAPSTGEGSTGEPAVTCEPGECSVSCTQMVPKLDDNGVECFCEESPNEPPDGWLICDLPEPCANEGNTQTDYVCTVQALRWGVVSRHRWYGFEMDDGSRSSQIEVLGDGTARVQVSTGEEYKCCDDSTQHLDVWYGPLTVPPPDAAFWGSCFTDKAIDRALSGGFSSPLPPCLDPEQFADACAGAPLAACPSPQIPGPGCPESCPMAGDGICDEVKGTGLCNDGCDPVDCTCDTDVPGVCDEINRGGTCPIGSDPLDCTCEPNFPSECNEVDDGGWCPTGSDSDCR